jgi:hypothetical protein
MARHVDSLLQSILQTDYPPLILGDYEWQTRWVYDMLLVRSQSLRRISDILKGSFYANPMVEQVTVSDEDRLQFPEYYGNNICKSVTKMHKLPLTNI